MIRASARVEVLVQRLRLHAARLVAGRARNRRRRPQRTDWHKAAALWPDLFGDPRDGK
jgi:hypothetical protein